MNCHYSKLHDLQLGFLNCCIANFIGMLDVDPDVKTNFVMLSVLDFDVN